MSGPRVDGACGYCAYLQGVIHIGEYLLGLLKVSKDGCSTEHALIFVIVHVQDLFEGQNIDTVLELL
jgi:hypothetical protein